jgi:hypothetical protein
MCAYICYTYFIEVYNITHTISVGMGTEEDESSTGRVWAAGFRHITARSRLVRVLKLMNRLFR